MLLTTAPEVATVTAIHIDGSSVHLFGPHNLKRVSGRLQPPTRFCQEVLGQLPRQLHVPKKLLYMYLCRDRISSPLELFMSTETNGLSIPSWVPGYTYTLLYCGETEKKIRHTQNISVTYCIATYRRVSYMHSISEVLFTRPSLLQKRRLVCIAHLCSSSAYKY